MGASVCPDCRAALPAGPGPRSCPACAVAALTSSPAFRERYQVGPVLGSGDTGVVLRAVEADSGRPVAIKVFTRLDSAELTARFRREGEVLARIRHPNVVEFLEVRADLAFPYLAMELLPGGSLAGRIAKSGALSVRRAATVAGELLAALAACHAAGVVHRDVKPGNVLFDAAGRAKLADLGIARACNAGTLSPRGLVLGTPRYLSPEQARGEEVGAAADLYALGIVFHEMLAGEPPFTASNPFKLLKMHEEATPPSIADRVPGLPAGIAALIGRLLAKNARARPPTASAAAAELAAAIEGIGSAGAEADEDAGERAGAGTEERAGERTGPDAAASVPASSPGPAGEARTERLDAGDAAGALELTEAHLTIIEGPALGREVACGTRAVTIGSAPESDLEVPDAAVSRHHARLEPTGGGLQLRDLSSTNGTWVAGVRVQSVFVAPGDLIRMGKTTLSVRVKARSAGVPLHPAHRLGGMVGESAAMRQLFTVLEWMAPTRSTVLISGATGTGKELAARALHEAHARAGPFVVVDCAALDASAIASDLFGHEAGAFPGASARRAGLFEEARGGTLFLDEVAELSLDLQPRLLRVLESREVRPVGSNVAVPVDARVVAATNRSLDEMVARGAFREDLYHRLCQVKVAIPPLDERRGDIPLLVASFLDALPEAVRPAGVAPACMALFSSAHYPGNVRQLKNLVDRAAHLAPRRQVQIADLLLGPAELAALTAPPGETVPAARKRLSGKDALLQVLEANDWNLTHTAKALDIALNTLKTRMEKHRIPRRKPGTGEDS